MDGLSTAGSGFAVVSVTIQLADGIKKLHDFWNSIAETPEEIKDNLLELRVLSSLLTQIAHDKQRQEPDPTFADVLSECCTKVNRLTTLLGEIEPGLASTNSYVRRWTAVKAVLKQEKLRKFQESLARLKSTLSLALLHQNSRMSQDQHIFMKQSLVTLTQHLPTLSIQENQQEESSLKTTVSEISSGHTTYCGEDCNTTKLGVAMSTPGQNDLSFDQSDLPDSSSEIWQRKRRIRTPVQVAGHRNKTLYDITYAMLSEVSDTFRLLLESVDFTDQDGNGWKVLFGLCDASHILNGEPAARMAILNWMLRLFSSDIKTCGVERHYAPLLDCTLLAKGTGLAEASRILLRLGGPELIDKPIDYDGGYTILHIRVAYAEGQENLNSVLAHGPDIHRLGLDSDVSPEEESPLSIALYSSWAFRDWLDAMFTARKSFEEFVTQEIQRNHATHPGWKKKTLLSLSTYNYWFDYDIRRSLHCDDCTKEIIVIRVQPHWRHFLERIKHGIDPYYSPAEARSEVDEEESVEGRSMAKAVDNMDHPTDEAKALENYYDQKTEPTAAAKAITRPIASSDNPGAHLHRLWNLLIDALMQFPESQVPALIQLLAAIQNLPNPDLIDKTTPETPVDGFLWRGLPGFGHMWADEHKRDDWRRTLAAENSESRAKMRSAHVRKADIEARLVVAE
ncbi:MAG: hypothetical protein Q9180_003842, partial [Flavoplaca navasiana]